MIKFDIGIWAGNTTPENKYRLRWRLLDKDDNLLCHSSWTPNDYPSFSQGRIQSEGVMYVELEAEDQVTFETAIVAREKSEDILRLEYLALQSQGGRTIAAIALVFQDDRKMFYFINGHIHEE